MLLHFIAGLKKGGMWSVAIERKIGSMVENGWTQLVQFSTKNYHTWDHNFSELDLTIPDNHEIKLYEESDLESLQFVLDQRQEKLNSLRSTASDTGDMCSIAALLEAGLRFVHTTEDENGLATFNLGFPDLPFDDQLELHDRRLRLEQVSAMLTRLCRVEKMSGVASFVVNRNSLLERREKNKLIGPSQVDINLDKRKINREMHNWVCAKCIMYLRNYVYLCVTPRSSWCKLIFMTVAQSRWWTARFVWINRV